MTFALISAMILCYHQTAMVNILCHSMSDNIGYRNFNTKDNSKNIKWLSYLTFGQALHNNHHHAPGNYNYAARNNEFDVGLLLARIIGLKPRQQ